MTGGICSVSPATDAYPMTRSLLIRGMVAGLVAALCATVFARFFAEPHVDLAIAYETVHAHAVAHGMVMPEEPELVSRATQKGLGLLTAMTLYGVAVGGLFSLVFAASYGRLAMIGPRTLAVMLALSAFISISLVPGLKYPPTPPAVGLHETVAFRTACYFALIGISLTVFVMTVQFGKAMISRLGPFNGVMVAAAIYVIVTASFSAMLPRINEVPADFPAVVLWNFRIAAFAIQAVLWAVIGIVFGFLAEAAFKKAARQTV